MAYDSINSKTAKEINDQIKQWRNAHSFVKADNKRWYIGITKNPELREKQHTKKASTDGYSVSYFKFWNAKTKKIARAIESHWHDLEMRETDLHGNATDESIYVYVYKKYPLFN